MTRISIALCIIFSSVMPLLADEQVRQVQEELRKRNLYFGQIDGQPSRELTGALKRYQARKGFAVTGRVDADTATSLHVTADGLAATQSASWPDMTILRSDTAPQIPTETRIALEKRAEQEPPDPSPSPAPPAEAPAPGQNLTPDRVTHLVEEYLRMAETEDVAGQVRYYAFPVEYFQHGPVDERFVERDTRNYVKRWPQRHYALVEPVSFHAGGKEGETNIEFTISFDVRNKQHAVSGKTRNFWTVRPEGDELKIVSIREERVR